MTQLLFLFFILMLQVSGMKALASDPNGKALPMGHIVGGVNLVLWNSAYSDSQIIDMINDLRLKTGTRHIALPAIAIQTDKYATDIHANETSYEFMMREARIAEGMGLTVTFLPLAWGEKDQAWRGFFEPTDVGAWFDNYTAWLLRLAQEAQEFHHPYFVIGSELGKLNKYTDQWKVLVNRVRQVYSGPLVLSVNHDDENYEDLFELVDAIGVSGYYSLSNASDPSQDALIASWKNYAQKLTALSEKLGRPILFTEIGYPSIDTAAKWPWAYDPKQNVNPDLQLRCYKAFWEVWHSLPSFGGVVLWASSDPGSGNETKDFTFLDKPSGEAAKTIIQAINSTNDLIDFNFAQKWSFLIRSLTTSLRP